MATNRADRACGEGNTDSPPKQPQQYTYWCFTLNNYTPEQIEHLELCFRHECKWYVFQEEVGEKCGTPHLQGQICLQSRQRMTQLKRIDPKISWRATESCTASLTYCKKAETSTGKIYYHGMEVPAQIELDEPYGWQLDVVNLLKDKPHKRYVHWYWEPTGGKGKTTLAKYLVVKHDALMLTGKSNDMYHMISKYPRKRKLFVIDCPRSQQDYINYGAIEQIKNGLIFSGKYEGAQLVFNAPHVIVFANEPPDESKMSMDRWVITRI